MGNKSHGAVKNNMLGQIKWEQLVFLGNPEFACDLQPIDFAGIAIACGGAGYTVQDPSQCEAVLREAFAKPGLALVEAVVDPNDPPLLPEIRFEHAKHFVEALARGTTAAEDIARKVAQKYD